MPSVDLSQIQGAPSGYSGPPKRAYEADPDTKYYEDDRAGIEYYTLDGLSGLTKEAYDTRYNRKQEHAKNLAAKYARAKAQNEAARAAMKKEPPTITTEQPAPVAPPKETPGPGTPPEADPVNDGGGYTPGPGKPNPVSEEVLKELMKKGGKYVDNSFSARDINQNIGKQGDINTNITNSSFGNDAVIGNDQSSTEGDQNVGNRYEEYELGLGRGGQQRPEITDNGFQARDINSNVGKTGDINTNIEGSTFGDGAVIGNDYSKTKGSQNVGNTYSKRSAAKSMAQMFGKEGMFGKDGLFGGDGNFSPGGLRFS